MEAEAAPRVVAEDPRSGKRARDRESARLAHWREKLHELVPRGDRVHFLWPNPKRLRAGGDTAPSLRYDAYAPAKTLRAALDLGATRRDVIWDLDRGYATFDDPGVAAEMAALSAAVEEEADGRAHRAAAAPKKKPRRDVAPDEASGVSAAPDDGGELIEARFQGRAKYYPGRIVETHWPKSRFRDPTFDILYDDGDFEEKVPMGLIRPRQPPNLAPRAPRAPAPAPAPEARASSAPVLDVASAPDAPPPADEAVGGDAAPRASEAAGPEAAAAAADSQLAGAPRGNTSKYRGVSIHACGRIVAIISKNGACTYLGTFPSEEAAARAFDEEARKLGRVKSLNFPTADDLIQDEVPRAAPMTAVAPSLPDPSPGTGGDRAAVIALREQVSSSRQSSSVEERPPLAGSCPTVASVAPSAPDAPAPDVPPAETPPEARASSAPLSDAAPAPDAPPAAKPEYRPLVQYRLGEPARRPFARVTASPPLAPAPPDAPPPRAEAPVAAPRFEADSDDEVGISI